MKRLRLTYDCTMDWIACHIFPPPRPVGVSVAGHEITLIDLTLAFYTIAAAVGLWLWFDNWLWIPATFLSMIMAAMMLEWFL